jgi:putative NADH-flavin reductase
VNITIIGASAGVGHETARLPLLRKHNVTTLSRSEIQLPSNSNLTIKQGRATNKENLKKAIENTAVSIVILGTGESMKATTLNSDFAKI